MSIVYISGPMSELGGWLLAAATSLTAKEQSAS